MASGIITKLNYLKDTKLAIKQALLSKGQTILPETPFRDYVDLIIGMTGDPSDEGFGEDIMQLDDINGEVYIKTFDHADLINKLNGEVI